jgi:hypothetical protein
MTPHQSDAGKRWALGQLTAAALWFGMLAGVSFLATPAKFMAPSLTLPVALDVGRHTFLVFNRTEWLLSAVVLGLALLGPRHRLGLAGAAIAIVLVAAETLWLLPSLDARVASIIAGEPPAPSSLHMLYIVCEAAKLVALLLIVAGAARYMTGGGAGYRT